MICEIIDRESTKKTNSVMNEVFGGRKIYYIKSKMSPKTPLVDGRERERDGGGKQALFALIVCRSLRDWITNVISTINPLCVFVYLFVYLSLLSRLWLLLQSSLTFSPKTTTAIVTILAPANSTDRPPNMPILYHSPISRTGSIRGGESM